MSTVERAGTENVALLHLAVCSCLALTRGKHRAAAAPCFLNTVFLSLVELLYCDVGNKLLLVGKETAVEFNISTNVVIENVIDILATPHLF